MHKGIFKESSVFSKLMQLLLIFFVLSLIGMFAVNRLFGDTQDIQVLKISQLVLSVFTILLPPIICGYLWYEKPWQAYSLNKLPSLRQTILGIAVIFTISPFINLLSYINEQMVLPEFLSDFEKIIREMEDRAADLTAQMLDVSTASGLLFNLLVMAVMPAIGEELFCRGALQNIFSEKGNKYVAVWIVAVIFSLIHFQMYGFLPRMVMGALLGYLLVWSGSLWLPILAHFVNNGVIVIMSYFSKDSTAMDTFETIGKAETWGYGIASLAVSAVIISLIIKSAKNSKLETQN